MTETTGLRERKKAETRSAITRAALALAVERGYPEITLADIAERAGVSRRTISNYFPSKADCFAQLDDESLLTHLATEIANPAIGGTRERLAEAFREMPDEFWNECAVLHHLVSTEPEIAAVIARNQRTSCERISDEIVDLSGGAIDRLRMNAVTFAVAGCMNAALSLWLSEDSKGGVRALAGYVADSLSILDLSWLDPHLGEFHQYRASPAAD